MDTQSIRDKFLNAEVKTTDLEVPEWLAAVLDPGTELILKDIPGNVVGVLTKQAQKDPNQDDVTFAAGLICRCIANKTTGELIFQPSDRDAIAALGVTKLKPLNEQINAFLGIAQNAVAEAKKN